MSLENPINQPQDPFSENSFATMKANLELNKSINTIINPEFENSNVNIILETDKKVREEIILLRSYLGAKENYNKISKESEDAISKAVPLSSENIAQRLAQKQLCNQLIENFEKDYGTSEEAETFARARLSSLEEIRYTEKSGN